MTTQTTGGNKNNHNDDDHHDDGRHDGIVAMKMAVKGTDCVSSILEHLGTSDMFNHTVSSRTSSSHSDDAMIVLIEKVAYKSLLSPLFSVIFLDGVTLSLHNATVLLLFALSPGLLDIFVQRRVTGKTGEVIHLQRLGN